MKLPGEDFNEKVFLLVLTASIANPGKITWRAENHVDFAREIVRACYIRRSDALPNFVGEEPEK